MPRFIVQCRLPDEEWHHLNTYDYDNPRAREVAYEDARRSLSGWSRNLVAGHHFRIMEVTATGSVVR